MEGLFSVNKSMPLPCFNVLLVFGNVLVELGVVYHIIVIGVRRGGTNVAREGFAIVIKAGASMGNNYGFRDVFASNIEVYGYEGYLWKDNQISRHQGDRRGGRSRGARGIRGCSLSLHRS